MIINLNKFGTTLTSRQSGKEAYAAFLPSLKALKQDEEITIDCGGIDVLSPSWGDEFFTPLVLEYKDRLKVKNTENLSVKETLKMLEQIHGFSLAEQGK